MRSALSAILYGVTKYCRDRNRTRLATMLIRPQSRDSSTSSELVQCMSKAPCRDTQVLNIFVITAKNSSESQPFISTKGVFIMSRLVHGSRPRPLAQRQTRLALHAHSIETTCRLRLTYRNQAYANITVGELC